MLLILCQFYEHTSIFPMIRATESSLSSLEVFSDKLHCSSLW